jgi:DHA2 family multidrug resistance protein-like MFS transporter
MTMLDPRHVTDSARQRASARDWVALVVLMIPVLLTSIDNTVLSFALPQVSTSLRPSGEQLLWLVDIYPLMLAGLLVAMGTLGDRVGRRRLLLIGSTGFGVASVLAAYSPSAEALLVSRGLLGVFGAMLMPSTLSLIRNIFTDRGDRRLAIATWGSAFAGGSALGPIVGGWLLEHFWWGSVFLINVPLIALFLVLAVLLLPESRDPSPGRIDVPSIVLSMTAMLPVVFAIKQVAEHGLNEVVVTALVVGVVSGYAFIRRQRRLANPLIDLSLFSDRVFSGAIGANLLSFMGYVGFLFFAAQFLQLVVGLSPMSAATVLLPGLLVTVLAGFAAVRLVRFFPARALVAGSFVLSASGYAVAAFVGTPTTATIMLAFGLLGLGIGLAETLTNDLMLSSVPAHKAGAASAISETGYEVGAVLGTAALGSVLTATYRSHLTVPSEARWGNSDESFQTLGGTVQYANNDPYGVGPDLLASAHGAFDLAVQTTSAVAILIALGAAVVAWRTLKNA